MLITWLAYPSKSVSHRVRADMLRQLLSSPSAVMMGAITGLIVSGVCLARKGEGIFITLAILEMILLVVRFFVLRRVSRMLESGEPAFIDLPVTLSCLWCALQGVLAFFAMRTLDPVIMVLSSTMIMGLLGPLCSRNFAAPRLAFLLVCLCDFPFVAGAMSTGNPWFAILLLMTPFYLLGVMKIISSHKEAMILALTAEYTNLKRSQLIEKEKALAIHNASHDGLTGLLNRAAFHREVEARISDDMQGFIALLDLDKFKPINDLYGHDAGDFALKETAERLIATLPSESVIGRFGGDEFAIYLNGSGVENLERDICKVTTIMRTPFLLGHQTLSMSCSIGVAEVSSKTPVLTELLKEADAALLEAKASRDRDYVLFDEKVRQQKRRKNILERTLLDEEATGGIELVYQPIFELSGQGCITSIEALARWDHVELGAISPAEFIPASERLAAIDGFSNKLLSKAVVEAKNWPGSIRVAFNLSAVQLCSPNTYDGILKILAEHQFSPHRLNLEVTETAVLANFDNARANIGKLRDAGCRIVLDDFGAGYSSLQYLSEIEFDKIKLDGSLIHGARTTRGFEILQGVVELIRAIKLDCVAECIETERDLLTAKLAGCRFGQGYFLGRPTDQPMQTFGLSNEGVLKVA